MSRPSSVLHLGDCLDVLPTLEAGSVRLLLADPPYATSRGKKNLDRSHWTGPAARTRILVRDFGAWDQRTPEQHAEWMVAWLTEAYRVMAPGATAYVFCILEDCGRLKDWAKTCGFKWVMTVLWLKQNPAPQFVGARQFTYAAEAIGMFRRPGQPVTWNGNNTTRNWFMTLTCQGGERTLHPTQKPLAIITPLIEMSSDPGDLVLDPFLGSGSIAVAAKSLRRRYVGVEQDPDYMRVTEVRLGLRDPDEHDMWLIGRRNYLEEPPGPLFEETHHA